ncbi:MAG: hypothetical protein ACK4N5_07275, partial [Myxococcales bacterium]
MRTIGLCSALLVLLVTASCAHRSGANTKTALEYFAAGDAAFRAGNYREAQRSYSSAAGGRGARPNPDDLRARTCAAETMLRLDPANARTRFEGYSSEHELSAPLAPACGGEKLPPEFRAALDGARRRYLSVLLDHLLAPDVGGDLPRMLLTIGERLDGLTRLLPERSGEWFTVLQQLRARLRREEGGKNGQWAENYLTKYAKSCANMPAETRAACEAFFAGHSDDVWARIEADLAAGRYGAALKEVRAQRFGVEKLARDEAGLSALREREERIARWLTARAQAPNVPEGARLGFARMAALVLQAEPVTVPLPAQLVQLARVRT